MADNVPKPFTMADLASSALKVAVAPEKRTAIEEAIRTPAQAWKPYRESGRAGTPAKGEDLRAAFVEGAWLGFRETADHLELVFLHEDRAFREAGIKVRPAREGTESSSVP